jgi:hypothetical protein
LNYAQASEGNAASDGEDAVSYESEDDQGIRDQYEDEDEDDEDDENDQQQSGGEGQDEAASGGFEAEDAIDEFLVCPFEVSCPCLFYIVARNLNGWRQVDGEEGEFVVENLGTILHDLDGFHNEDFIFPVGYYVSRALASMLNPSDEGEYIFEIRYGGSSVGPIFVITNEQNEEYEGSSPEEAWDKVWILNLACRLSCLSYISAFRLSLCCSLTALFRFCPNCEGQGGMVNTSRTEAQCSGSPPPECETLSRRLSVPNDVQPTFSMAILGRPCSDRKDGQLPAGQEEDLDYQHDTVLRRKIRSISAQARAEAKE